MRETIRCCISCILPCGALDVIRIVHVNGHVEEISGTVRAAEVMKAHPKHVLKKPCRSQYHNDVVPVGPTIVVVPPDAQLQRGKIYFLIPVGPTSTTKQQKEHQSSTVVLPSSVVSSSSSSSTSTRRRRRRKESGVLGSSNSISVRANNMVFNDQYLSEILSEKISTGMRDKRRGRVGVWRPHLESITETLSEAASYSSTATTTDQ